VSTAPSGKDKPKGDYFGVKAGFAASKNGACAVAGRFWIGVRKGSKQRTKGHQTI
jgi:hypothetical protein